MGGGELMRPANHRWLTPAARWISEHTGDVIALATAVGFVLGWLQLVLVAKALGVTVGDLGVATQDVLLMGAVLGLFALGTLLIVRMRHRQTAAMLAIILTFLSVWILWPPLSSTAVAVGLAVAAFAAWAAWADSMLGAIVVFASAVVGGALSTWTWADDIATAGAVNSAPPTILSAVLNPGYVLVAPLDGQPSVIDLDIANQVRILGYTDGLTEETVERLVELADAGATCMYRIGQSVFVTAPAPETVVNDGRFVSSVDGTFERGTVLIRKDAPVAVTTRCGPDACSLTISLFPATPSSTPTTAADASASGSVPPPSTTAP